MYGFLREPIGTLPEGWAKDSQLMPTWAFPNWPDWMGPQGLVSGIIAFAVIAIVAVAIWVPLDRKFIRPRHNKNR